MQLREKLGRYRHRALEHKTLLGYAFMVASVAAMAYVVTDSAAVRIARKRLSYEMREEAIARRPAAVDAVRAAFDKIVVLGKFKSYEVKEIGSEEELSTVYLLPPEYQLAVGENTAKRADDLYIDFGTDAVSVPSVNMLTHRLVDAKLRSSPEVLEKYAITKEEWRSTYRYNFGGLAAMTLVATWFLEVLRPLGALLIRRMESGRAGTDLRLMP